MKQKFIKLPWVSSLMAVFLIILLAIPMSGGVNPLSRFAMMAAMAEDHTFSINSLAKYTVDWGQTPDGNYYSNKAPGPALLGFAVYYPIDRLALMGIKDPTARYHQQWKISYGISWLMSMLFQALPFVIVLFLIFSKLKVLIAKTHDHQSSENFLMWGALAALFGNTASIFMNTYFGHAMAAVIFLMLLISVQKRNLTWMAFYFGCLLMTDYGSVILVPWMAIYFSMELFHKKSLASFLQIIKGAALPGVLWIWYHQSSFGSPFRFANHYANPDFVEQNSQRLLGMFGMPQWHIVEQLLVGPSRGLLWTQPWIFWVLFYMIRSLFTEKNPMIERRVSLFALGSFMLMFFLNTTFNGWHGGGSSGPRYLSLALPALAIFVPLYFSSASLGSRWILRISVIYSVLFFCTVFNSSLLIVPDVPTIWHGLLHDLSNRAWGTLIVRMGLMLFLFGGFVLNRHKIWAWAEKSRASLG